MQGNTNDRNVRNDAKGKPNIVTMQPGEPQGRQGVFRFSVCTQSFCRCPGGLRYRM